MIQQKVRKKRPVLMSCRRKVKRGCPMYDKQMSLKGVYSWNKMRSLKSLVMSKCESTISLHAVQYSDSQVLF